MIDEDLMRQIMRRSALALSVFALAGLVLIGRAAHLQLIDSAFLLEQGDARQLRVEILSAHRGSILDRNGEPLAVSTPVDSVWANPQQLLAANQHVPALAVALDVDTQALMNLLTRRSDREFVYLRRHMAPDDAARVEQLEVPGVHLQREYRRYYPAGEVAVHVLGFTDIDDLGQEGLELAFNEHLRGEPGSKRVLRDRLGRTIAEVESIQAARRGEALTTSIDLRLQYLAYRELKAAVQQHGARSGSMVVMDVHTGEVLAMVNQPSLNPNDRRQFRGELYRNRAVTDIFEPGSAFKPFVIAAALESGEFTTDSIIDTGEGSVLVGSKTISDPTPLGRIDLPTILRRSSNVGATLVALQLRPDQLWGVLSHFGFGHATSSGFPGESGGLLNQPGSWRPIGQATLAYGYGVSVTPLQLAQAYAALGNGGRVPAATFLRSESVAPSAEAVDADTAAAILAMLESVVGEGGTARAAAVPGFRIAGKTGTSRKYVAGGYSEDRHVAIFAGLAPASAPRIAAVVVLDEPQRGEYYGGDVAAPVFASVVGGALRLMDIPPDDLPEQTLRVAVHPESDAPVIGAAGG
jgi:cell division protein FtsI (penicillin-binding protein 3)